MLFQSSMPFLSFSTCPINYREEVLKFPSINMELAISPFSSISFCFVNFVKLFFFISSITRIVVSSWWMNCSIHAMTLLISGNIPCSELCLILIQHLWLSLRLGLTSICFPCFHFKPTGTLLYIQGKFLYRLIDTDNKVMVTRWRRSRGEGSKRERIKKKLAVTKT